jgi:hypothetical protein
MTASEISLHVILLTLSLDGRLKRDKPKLIKTDSKIEIVVARPKVVSKRKVMFFIGDDE